MAVNYGDNLTMMSETKYCLKAIGDLIALIEIWRLLLFFYKAYRRGSQRKKAARASDLNQDKGTGFEKKVTVYDVRGDHRFCKSLPT